MFGIACLKKMPDEILTTIGLIGDVQYSEREDGWNYHRTAFRRYKGSLEHLRRAVTDWNTNGTSLVLQVGDLLDGACRRDGHLDRAVKTVTKEIDALKSIPIHHCIGNHELYNFQREELWNNFLTVEVQNSALRRTLGPVYYAFNPCPNWRVVILDSYDVSILGRPENHPIRETAMALLKHYNQNEDLNGPPQPDNQRYTAYNGAMGSEQLLWLQTRLEESQKVRDNVIIAMHIPVLLEASLGPSELLWNYETVLEILRKFTCVRLVVTGHTHVAGWAMDGDTLHLTLPGVIEAKEDETSHLTLQLYRDKLCLSGNDTVPPLCHSF